MQEDGTISTCTYLLVTKWMQLPAGMSWRGSLKKGSHLGNLTFLVSVKIMAIGPYEQDKK